MTKVYEEHLSISNNKTKQSLKLGKTPEQTTDQGKHMNSKQACEKSSWNYKSK